MKRPPRNADDGIFADGLGFDVAFQGIVITVLTLASYFIGHYLEAGRWEIVNSPDGLLPKYSVVIRLIKQLKYLTKSSLWDSVIQP